MSKIDFVEQASPPAAPSSGHVVMYAKTDGGMYAKDDTGLERPLGGPALIAAGTQSASAGSVVFANSNGVTFGMSGSSQITASVQTQPQVSMFQWPINPGFGAAASAGSIASVVTLGRMSVPLAIAATALNFVAMHTNSSSAGGTVSMSVGVYTMSGSTAGLASSASRTWGYNSTGPSSYTNQSGTMLRTLNLGGTWSMSAGDYLFAWLVSISTSGTSGLYQFGQQVVNGPPAFEGGGVFTKNFPTMGSVGSSAFPTTMHLTQIGQTLSAGQQLGNLAVAFVGTF